MRYNIMIVSECEQKVEGKISTSHVGKKVVLVMPTFWDVIAPPVGIVSLKSYLQQYGHVGRAVNLNEFSQVYNSQKEYFGLINKYVPYRGLIPRLGEELLGFHMNAAVFKEDLPQLYDEYVELLLLDHFKIFLEKYSPHEIKDLVQQLNLILENHFVALRELVPVLLEIKPEYVGFTVLSSTLGTALFLGREVKKYAPEVKILLGGPGHYNGFDANSPNMARLIEKCPFVDKVVFGEGEEVFRKYLEEGHEGKKNIAAVDLGIKKMDMDCLPTLDFSDLNLGKYFHLGIGASRGCSFLCSFCSETKLWAVFRRASPHITVHHIESLIKTYGINSFFFTDALYNHSLTPFIKLLLEKCINIEFDCYLRIDTNGEKQEMTDLWAKGGLHRVRIGMESSSPKVLKVMQKGITVQQQSNALKCLARSGIRTSTYWIAGHPGEDEDNFQETLDFIVKHKDYLYEVDLAVFYFYGEGELGKDSFVEESGGLEERWGSKYMPLSIFKYFKLKNPRPSREEAYHRAIKFVQTMEREGIPCNRTSAIDYVKAERRWKRLVEEHQRQRNAIPQNLECSPVSNAQINY